MKYAVLAGMALAFAFLQSTAQAGEKAWYLIAQIKITDQKTYFGTYGAKVEPLLQKAGAEILVATPNRQLLEGVWTGNWTVVVKFPSKAKALEWYRSNAYQAVRPKRLQSTTINNLILAPNFVPPKKQRKPRN